MNKIFAAIIGFLLLSLPLSSHAFDSTYFSGQIGYTVIDDLVDEASDPFRVQLSADNSWGAGIAVGRDFGYLRFETELAYQINDFDRLKLSAPEGTFQESLSGDIWSLAVLFNLYHDFKNASRFTPFVTGGIGVARIEMSSIRDTDRDFVISGDSDTVFAYQVGAGVGYEAYDNIFFDLKYRYYSMHDPKFNGVEFDYRSHNFYLGLRVPFI